MLWETNMAPHALCQICSSCETESMYKAFLGVAIIIVNVSTWNKFAYALVVLVHHILVQCQHLWLWELVKQCLCARVTDLLDPADSWKSLQ